MTRIERSFEAARTLVNTIDHYTLSTRRPLTLAVGRNVMVSAE